jgi:hypothetical protein
MPNLPPNFNWKESPPHLDLLDKFAKSRDVKQVLDWQTIRQTLRENTESAIERFIRDGALVPSSLEESLECIFQVAQLKKLLLERGLKVSGSKSELIGRLVPADRAGMEKYILKCIVMKCSPMALEILSDFEKNKQRVLEIAKVKSFEALKNNNPKDAYKIYVYFQRKFIDPVIESSSYEVEELQHILMSQPKVLAGITPDNLRFLKAAACMQSLWRDELPETWLSSTFSSGLKNNRVAINYLTTHARIKREVEGYKSYAKQIRIVFDPGDIDSCELCQSLNKKVFDIDKVPDLPMTGCTSETGCKCRIEDVFSDDEEEYSLKLSIDSDELETKVDPVEKLRRLRQMLNEELITCDEYEKKKGEILARF